MLKYERLFSPVSIGKVTAKNRYAMAPMGPIGFSDANGAFNEAGVEYYVARAKGGTGLIMTGICAVDLELEGLAVPVLPCPTYNPAAFAMNAGPMNERIHAYGAVSFMQLTAGFGRAGLPHIISKAVAPSQIDNRWDPSLEHREMTIEEIQKLIKSFAMSAAVAQKAGFDGVEIHAVHEGYLLDQFTMELYNKRTDQYGGIAGKPTSSPDRDRPGDQVDVRPGFPRVSALQSQGVCEGLSSRGASR